MKKVLQDAETKYCNNQNNSPVIYDYMVTMVEEIGDNLYKFISGGLIIKAYACYIPFYQRVMLRYNKNGYDNKIIFPV